VEAGGAAADGGFGSGPPKKPSTENTDGHERGSLDTRHQAISSVESAATKTTTRTFCRHRSCSCHMVPARS